VLREGGFSAYVVGGAVRDLLLGITPKDYDVATDARPEQIRELFRNCRLIGRRFRLAHVRFGPEIVEVSTFRAAHHVADGEGRVVEGRIVRDNVYGTIDDDVWRRDFTANALFYNIEDFSVVDYVSGVEDIRAGLIRLIGDPLQRYTEDAVRLLRAVRFAAKLGFRIHPDTERPIPRLAHLLKDIPAARLFEEVLKLFLGGCAVQTFEQLRHYGLFATLFPQTESVLAEEEGGFPRTLVIHALQNTDQRIAADKPVTPGFLIAAFLWLPVRTLAAENLSRGLPEGEAISLAADSVISRQVASTAIPRRFTQMAREIWQLQPRFARRSGRRPQGLVRHPSFRAAYDFLMLRAAAGEGISELAQWWTAFQEGKAMPEPAGENPPARRRRRRPRGRRRHHADSGGS